MVAPVPVQEAATIGSTAQEGDESPADVCGVEEESGRERQHEAATAKDFEKVRAEKAATAKDFEKVRAEKAWASYTAFLAAPGNKCSSCWLLSNHCCCVAMKTIKLRPSVIVLMHHVELSQHRGSNTAKLLLQFGAELLAWGVEEHDRRFRELIDEDPGGTAILFPSHDAVDARDFATKIGDESNKKPLARIVVLDGGWRECRRMNEWIGTPAVARCRVSTASRCEFGGTRKYCDHGGADDGERVQTAAAFVALLQEIGEDPADVAAVRAGLAHFVTCWETQIGRSKT
eukprot:gnl/TRDRNA2_/TRDRNA2_91187_c0_seq1.p1 gnl/TRDRNA2_/TRDRNA2_91187_c0~~gnl/TRDRNA2_/TRDRNA2_91187_c0_seq1.p1  ORF type:complete len:288 (+),score=55.55 gnl/TRDRNA2_/TRDRNA2_91187_c0_seq1:212-1075(+)